MVYQNLGYYHQLSHWWLCTRRTRRMSKYNESQSCESGSTNVYYVW